MITIRSSLRNKVRLGYYVCLALIVVVSLLNYFNLERISRKISFSLIISEFFDATLEMRRFEKNYFLYGVREDFVQNEKYTEKAEDIIQRNKYAIKRLSIKTDVYALEDEIKRYKSLMLKYFHLDKKPHRMEAHLLESEIRERGKKIVTATEAIALVEKAYVQSLITSSKRVLAASIIFLVFSGWLISQYLSRMVVKPLKQLENSMRSIADGNFDSYDILSREASDREIISLSNAYRRMIKELELRQVNFIAQSEKLISLGTMTSGVAHQLNNPLSNISTSCQILQEEIEESDLKYKKELLRQIEEQVGRAKTMVHSLLEYSRKKEFKSKELSLGILVEETIGLIRGDIPSNVEMKVRIPDTICVIVDKQRMEQAFLNLIKNAIDAIPDEGKISITAREDIENKIAEIIIEDNGIGIEPEQLKKIFEPFFTTKDDEKGSGLGLFVAREIIEEHGGFIEVKSTAGEGTTFLIKLPLKES
jgi:two-component system NtrC family sensor kinase